MIVAAHSAFGPISTSVSVLTVFDSSDFVVFTGLCAKMIVTDIIVSIIKKIDFFILI
jgi:hypothetical protein